RHNAWVRTFRFDKQVVVAADLKFCERRLDFGSIQGTFEPFNEPHGAFQALLQHGGISLFAVLTGRFGVQLNVNALVVLGPFYCPQRLHFHVFVAGEEAEVEIVSNKAWLREFPWVDEVRAPALHSNNELVHGGWRVCSVGRDPGERAPKEEPGQDTEAQQWLVTHDEPSSVLMVSRCLTEPCEGSRYPVSEVKSMALPSPTRSGADRRAWRRYPR